MKRYLIVLLLVMLAPLWLAGCAGADQPVISFMVSGDTAELAAYQTLVAAFETEHPEIDISLQHIPSEGEYRQRLAAGFSSGAAPDVMLINYRRFGTFADQGGLEPLTDYLAGSQLIAAGDFYPAAIDAFQWQQDLWCVPQNVSSLVVYYNRDLFDAAGVPYPAGEWTWLDFLAAAQALTRDLDGDGQIDQYGVGLEPNLIRLAPFIWQNGGRLVDDQTNPTRLTLDEPAALDAFLWFADLQVKHHVVPDAVAEAAETSESRFLNGTLGMLFNSRRGVPTYRTITSFAWDVAPLPRGRQQASILHSDGYCMAATARDKDAAWTFIEFANSPAGQTIVAQTGRTVPSLIAVAESDAFLEPNQSPANSRVFLDALSIMQRVPVMSTWIAIEETAGAEIERAFYGQIPVEAAIDLAIQRTQTYFAQDSLPR